MDLIKILPKIYNLIDKPTSRFEILRKIGLDPNTKKNYTKIDECIDMGFLQREKLNSQTFKADKKRIWHFWNETPIGKDIMKMVDSNSLL